MTDKLRCVLLIDDDEDDNYFHSLVLKGTGVIDEIRVAENATEALSFFNDVNFKPELIFLDINMPGINGWEFLEEFNKNNAPVNSVIVMLTTSMSPQDKKRADNSKRISRFETKPLNRMKIRAILSGEFDITLE
jgi:CheY-like chemotaxis protein